MLSVLFRNGSDALAFAHLEFKNFLSDLVTASFSTFVPHEAHKDLATLAVPLNKQMDLNNICDEV